MTFDDHERFVASLAAGPSGDFPVYAHQQLYLDYRGSVVAKIAALRALGNRVDGIRPDFLWIDTDRCGSDKLSLRLYLPGSHRPIPVRLAPPGCDDHELRFVHTDPVRLRQAVDHMVGVVRSASGGTSARLARLDRLIPRIEEGGTLAELNGRVTDFLFEEVLAFKPRPVLVSELTESGELAQSLDTILNRLPEFVAIFNERIATLRSRNVDPKVHPLCDDYLPLFVTLPGERRRTRLRLMREGRMHLAWTVDQAGVVHRYPLGRDRLSMEHLGQHVNYSPDVTLPILVNERYSGIVCGKSSALYMLVFAEVMRKVLKMTPIPVLVPQRWDVFGAEFDSLLVAFLDGRTV